MHRMEETQAAENIRSIKLPTSIVLHSMYSGALFIHWTLIAIEDGRYMIQMINVKFAPFILRSAP